MLYALDSCVCSPQSWRRLAISRRSPLQQLRPRLRLQSLPPLPQLLRPPLRLQLRPRQPQHPRLSRRSLPKSRPLVLLSIVVAPVPDAIPEYDRGEWRHWTDEDGDCQDARQEALVAESVGPVAYEDSRRCRVASGAWVGPYTGEQFTDPGRLDVDHMVPLGNAHQSGGWAWSPEEKRQYANDLSYDNHLIAVQASANRAKGSRSPAEWKPPDRGYWCQYAVDWIAVKNTWQLTAVEPEAEALREMLGTCAPSQALIVVQADPVETTEPTPTETGGAPSPSPTPASTYASCDAAVAAGEPRVQGSSGSGRGFPAAKVPNARDGDSDGVVCER